MPTLEKVKTQHVLINSFEIEVPDGISITEQSRRNLQHFLQKAIDENPNLLTNPVKKKKNYTKMVERFKTVMTPEVSEIFGQASKEFRE